MPRFFWILRKTVELKSEFNFRIMVIYKKAALVRAKKPLVVSPSARI